MKKILLCLLVIIAALLVQSCAPPRTQMGHTYEYKYEMLNTMRDSAFYFIDGNVEVLLNIQRDRIEFLIVNLTRDALKINWDEAAIVFNGEAQKVIHSGVAIIDKNKSMPKSVIPPNAKLEDFAIPTKNVEVSAYSNRNTKDLLIYDDYGIKSSESYVEVIKNLKFSLYLPIVRKTEQIDYSFEFRIKDVIRKPKRGQQFIDNKKKIKDDMY
jgi:hypothetical protein